MAVPEKFKGYGSFSKEDPTTLKLFEFQPKSFDEYDVDIKVSHCGVTFLVRAQLNLSRCVEVISIPCVQGGVPRFIL